MIKKIIVGLLIFLAVAMAGGALYGVSSGFKDWKFLTNQGQKAEALSWRDFEKIAFDVVEESDVEIDSFEKWDTFVDKNVLIKGNLKISKMVDNVGFKDLVVTGDLTIDSQINSINSGMRDLVVGGLLSINENNLIAVSNNIIVGRCLQIASNARVVAAGAVFVFTENIVLGENSIFGSRIGRVGFVGAGETVKVFGCCAEFHCSHTGETREGLLMLLPGIDSLIDNMLKYSEVENEEETSMV